MRAMADNPRVHLPPPLWYVAAMALGAWLSHLWPWRIGNGLPRVIAAYTLAGVALALAASCFAHFWSRGTSVLPIRPATALVEAGPYRFTRNPMYVAMAALTLAVALWVNTWWIVLLLLPALLAVDRLVIAREEQYLLRRFGPDYRAYMLRVRRWL